MTNIIHRSFPKIRISNKIRKGPLQEKFHERDIILKQMSHDDDNKSIKDKNKLIDKLDVIEDNIAEMCADKNRMIIEAHIAHLSNTDGEFSAPKMWALKKKIAPKAAANPPTAKKDKQGNLITNADELLKLYESVYDDRLGKDENIYPNWVGGIQC